MKRIYLTAPFASAGETYHETRVAIVSDAKIIALSESVPFPLAGGIQSVEVIPIDCYFSSKEEKDHATLIRFGLI
jgi:hypothetical protein